MKVGKGFTLIELLVVIAIIGILAAIIFPVYSRVKDQAYRSSDMSNMNAIRTALQLYRSDQGGFPPALLGYATDYSGFEPETNVVPANLVQNALPWTQNSAFLYSKRINSLPELTPAYDRTSNTAFTTAIWPAGVSPQIDPANPQVSGSADIVSRCADIVEPGGPDNGPQLVTNYYYNISGYDVETVDKPGGGGSGSTQVELRYAPFWSQYTVPISCAPPTFNVPGGGTQTTGGSANDSPRQLGYSDPPETTVVTWDSFFREYDSNGNVVPGEKREIVLFWGGSARMMDSAAVAQQGFQANP